ncbi:hypothetical protein KCP77_02455 [Salmonella enterica subsp. enterica]|nr:hypothetical protein KCP77_02455 [Salmonella enterica subsp. enterica]
MPTGLAIHIADPSLAAVMLPRCSWAINVVSCGQLWSAGLIDSDPSG